MKLTPVMTHYFMNKIFNNLRRELDPFIVDIVMTLIQGEKIQLKFALDKEFVAVITIHENIFLHFQRHFITRDKMEIRRSVYVYPEQLPKMTQSMVIPADDSLCVFPGDPIMQVGNLIKAIDQDRNELIEVLRRSYICRKRKTEKNI